MVRLQNLVPSLKRRFQKLFGQHIEVIWISNPQLDSIAAEQVWVEDILFDMAIHARSCMPFGGRLVIECANIHPEGPSSGLEGGRYLLFEMTCLRLSLSEFKPAEPISQLGPLADELPTFDFSHAKKLISSFGGQIYEYNEPGRALTIRAFFPSESDSSNTLKEMALNDEQSGIKILLVEDESYVREVASEILRSEGYEVLTARTGKDAIEIFEHSGPFHLLVTDVIMPGMNGQDLSARLTSASPALKTIYMSGYNDALGAEVRRGVERSFLQKPFTLEALTVKVKEALSAAAI